jgi:hypothetical protein
MKIQIGSLTNGLPRASIRVDPLMLAASDDHETDGCELNYNRGVVP